LGKKSLRLRLLNMIQQVLNLKFNI
jgi:hypothetical protein